MSAPVDVLAVTRALGIEGARVGSRAVGHDGPERDEWEEYVEVPVTKLAAIAELIEADKRVSERSRKKAGGGFWMVSNEDMASLRAALARVGSAGGAL